MRYSVLACDYDGTLARDGRVEEATVVDGGENPLIFGEGLIVTQISR